MTAEQSKNKNFRFQQNSTESMVSYNKTHIQRKHRIQKPLKRIWIRRRRTNEKIKN